MYTYFWIPSIIRHSLVALHSKEYLRACGRRQKWIHFQSPWIPGASQSDQKWTDEIHCQNTPRFECCPNSIIFLVCFLLPHFHLDPCLVRCITNFLLTSPLPFSSVAYFGISNVWIFLSCFCPVKWKMCPYYSFHLWRHWKAVCSMADSHIAYYGYCGTKLARLISVH